MSEATGCFGGIFRFSKILRGMGHNHSNGGNSNAKVCPAQCNGRFTKNYTPRQERGAVYKGFHHNTPNAKHNALAYYQHVHDISRRDTIVNATAKVKRCSLWYNLLSKGKLLTNEVDFRTKQRREKKFLEHGRLEDLVFSHDDHDGLDNSSSPILGLEGEPREDGSYDGNFRGRVGIGDAEGAGPGNRIACTSRLLNLISTSGPFTMFVPNNEAIAKIGKNSWQTMRDNPDLLLRFLKRHLVLGKFDIPELVNSYNAVATLAENGAASISATDNDGPALGNRNFNLPSDKQGKNRRWWGDYYAEQRSQDQELENELTDPNPKTQKAARKKLALLNYLEDLKREKRMQEEHEDNSSSFFDGQKEQLLALNKNNYFGDDSRSGGHDDHATFQCLSSEPVSYVYPERALMDGYIEDCYEKHFRTARTGYRLPEYVGQIPSTELSSVQKNLLTESMQRASISEQTEQMAREKMGLAGGDVVAPGELQEEPGGPAAGQIGAPGGGGGPLRARGLHTTEQSEQPQIDPYQLVANQSASEVQYALLEGRFRRHLPYGINESTFGGAELRTLENPRKKLDVFVKHCLEDQYFYGLDRKVAVGNRSCNIVRTVRCWNGIIHEIDGVFTSS
ncbi:unnamed protein product [Amoebophrya sp. A120]|nr:unnamed protein product [Amoebophrya sp. A120]|eukprot:GSA120T00000261001.1